MSLTDAGGCSEISFVSNVAVAAERSDAVDALTVTAQIWQHLTLVDVWNIVVERFVLNGICCLAAFHSNNKRIFFF